MGWECLDKIAFNGVTYNLPIISQTWVNWVANQGVTGGVQYNTGYTPTDNGSIYPFKIPDLAYHREDLYFASGNYLNCWQNNSPGQGGIQYFYNSGNVMSSGLSSGGSDYPRYFGIIINHETQQAKIWGWEKDRNNLFMKACTFGSSAILTYFYNDVVGAIPPSYNWSSVPAISGKNGILSLPILIDTDGNPVSNGSASDFSTLPDSVKVRTLADLAVQ